MRSNASAPPIRKQVTLLIEQASTGDSHAAQELLPLIYGELRKLASSNMNNEASGGAGQTLQPTALVHEAYLRLVGPEGAGQTGWNSRGHFFGAAAIAMRRILIDRARARATVKRGGDRTRLALTEDATACDDGSDAASDQMLALDAALTRLGEFDERKARVVMLRYFAGLSIEQTAMAIGISVATTKTDWAFARAWLSKEIAENSAEA